MKSSAQRDFLTTVGMAVETNDQEFVGDLIDDQTLFRPHVLAGYMELMATYSPEPAKTQWHEALSGYLIHLTGQELPESERAALERIREIALDPDATKADL